jgi:hypothetical protein
LCSLQLLIENWKRAAAIKKLELSREQRKQVILNLFSGPMTWEENIKLYCSEHGFKEEEYAALLRDGDIWYFQISSIVEPDFG